MTRRAMVLAGPLAFVAALGPALMAHAALLTSTQSQTINVVSPALVMDTAAVDTVQALSFNRFNSGLGTLVSVSFSLNSSIVLNATLTGTGTDSDSAAADATATVQLVSGAGLISVPSVNVGMSLSCVIGFDPCTDSDTSTTSLVIPPFAGAAALSSYIGGASFTIDAKLGTSLLSITTPDNNTGSSDGSWTGTLKLVYTYETPTAAVPEPITLYGVGAGLAALALVRRRRHR